MTKYFCHVCQYDAKQKSNYAKHLKTKKHILFSSMAENVYGTPILSDEKDAGDIKDSNVLESQENTKDINKRFKCKYCDRSYKYSQGLSEHLRKSCQSGQHENLKELVKLLNKKVEYMESPEHTNTNDINKNNKAIKKLEKKLAFVDLGGNSITNIQNIHGNNYNTNNTINNCNYTINNTQNITVNYKDTGTCHLTPSDYKQIIGRKINCIPEMIRRIHCNAEHPENMNIFIPNFKNKFIMVYENGDWKLQNRNTVILDLIEDKTCRLEEWIDESTDADLKKKFEEYICYRDENYDEVTKEIKSQVIMDLYNNRRNIKKISK